jgi:hypothetical protein
VPWETRGGETTVPFIPAAPGNVPPFFVFDEVRSGLMVKL